MKRIGIKGEGRFKRISWDKALKEIVSRMKEIIRKHGPQAILHYEYAGHCGLLNYYCSFWFSTTFGASETFSSGEPFRLEVIGGLSGNGFPHIYF
ncbi:MAG: molybdopterin-dependent oxidoreductase [Candidatus Baldrarchaeia archaeon]|mgnify:CR=1 FL=1